MSLALSMGTDLCLGLSLLRGGRDTSVLKGWHGEKTPDKVVALPRFEGPRCHRC